MANVKWDTKSFDAGVKRLNKATQDATEKAINEVANEVLRLSQFEVPHDTGLLQNSGHVEPGDWRHTEVGYNKVYAARLHEHPEYRFQKGRKGKYLIDPIMHNLHIFNRTFAGEIEVVFK